MNPQPPFVTAVFLLTRGRKMSDNHRQKIRRHLLHTVSLRATSVAWQSRFAICRASRGQYLLDCFAMLAMTQYVIPVIIIQLRARPCHREPSQMAWRSRVTICRASRGHYLLDCFVTLAMTGYIQVTNNE